MSAAKAPPRKNAATRPTSRAATVQVETESVTERRAKGLMELAQLGQGILLLTGQYADAAAVGQHFQPIAVEGAKIADSNEPIAKGIDLIIEVGPYGAFVAALMPLALQIAANHRWIDPTKLMGQGIIPPEVLEAQMKANVAKMQSDAMKAQRQALNEARQAEKEFQEMMAEAA